MRGVASIRSSKFPFLRLSRCLPLVAALAFACGGNSEETNFDRENTGGSSSGNGGTGGSGQGGSSGSATGGDAGTVGTGGASGSSGSAGTAGTGAMRGYHPPDRHKQGCVRQCEREAEAMCPNETTTEKCVSDCNLGILFEPCAALWDPVFACVDATEAVVCDADGEAAMLECAAPYLRVLSCILGEGLPDDLEPLCTSQCEAAAAAECPNADTAGDCLNGCLVIGGAFPVCRPQLDTFLACAAAAEQTCGAGGAPEAAECAAEYVRLLSCIVSEYDYVP